MINALLVFLSWCNRCSKSAEPCVRIIAVTNQFGLAAGRFFFFFVNGFTRGSRMGHCRSKRDLYIFFLIPALKISVYRHCSVEYLLAEYGVYWYVNCKHREFGAH